jgi:hypothetical protein
MQSMRYDIKTPATSSWNLSVQRQVASDWLVSATYIGTQTSHIWTQKPLNPAIFLGLGPCTLNGVSYATCSTAANTNQRRRFHLERPADGQLMANVADTDDGGTQSYNGLLLSLERRVTSGVSVNGNYTWSHCIGDYADVNSQGPAADETYLDPTNRGADRGDCLSERRQVFNLTTLLETPQFENTTLRRVFTGWRLSGIYKYATGTPLTVVTGSNRSLTGTGLGGANNQRVNQVLPDVYGDRSGRPLTNYLNAAAFALPALGTFGNMNRNTVRAPGTWSFDIALSRTVPVSENQRLEFRAEAFNVPNSFRPGVPNVTLTSAQFGQLRTSLDPRILQFALKYVF